MSPPIRPRRGICGALIASLVPAFVAFPAPAAAAVPEAPSLGLIAADGSVRLSADEVDGSQIGLWVAASGGEFRIRARRPGYGRWEGAQVDARSGAVLRAVPAHLLDGATGFARFLDVRFLKRGRPVARQVLGLCPAFFERVSDDGPRAPTYFGTCVTGFPFLRGTVWGIDRGWASAVGGFGPAVGGPPRLRPGRYQVIARIRAPFRRLFGIPAARAVARLRLRVDRRRGSGRRRERTAFPVPPGWAAERPLRAQLVERPDPAALPDLIALPPWNIGTRRKRHRDLLRFAGSPWNAGPAPLLVEGYRRPGRGVMQAVQYFVDQGGEVTGSAPVGRMAFHDRHGHDHWHFLQFVSYRILRPSGREVVRSRKQSFCLASTDAVDLTLPGARLVPDFVGLGGSICGDARSIWIRETLPAGWADTYGPSVAGQDFDITPVPNGRYLLEMRVNPRGELHETTPANNSARRRIVLSGKRGQRRVRVAPWRGIRR